MTATDEKRRKTTATQKSERGVVYPVFEYRTVTLEGEITIEIDHIAILKSLGVKALRSKGGKAQEASGAVVVTARNIREKSSGEWKRHLLYDGVIEEEAAQ